METKFEMEQKEKILDIIAQRDEYEKQVFDLKQLLEISKSLNTTLDYSILIDSILYIIMGQMKVLKAALYAKKGIESARFYLHRNCKGFDIDHNHDYSIADNAPAMRLFAKETRAWSPEQIKTRLDGYGGLEPLLLLDPCLIVPMKAKGIINGLILVGDPILSSDFSDYDRDYIFNIAILASTTINNAFLFEMTTTDMMTKLRMKHYFVSALSEKMEESAFTDNPLSVIMCDIDHFKLFNDQYGHSCGDEVLKMVAKLIQSQTRANDVAARYGGEEFCIMLPGTGIKTANIIAERIRQKVEKMHLAYENKTLSVTLSLGLAQYDPDKDLSPKALIDRADKAMYLSKQRGRNRVSTF
ncbi:sensor domain-containing diguanylate cyclase [Spirochaetota bacterium]